jgi:hypothetical protein
VAARSGECAAGPAGGGLADPDALVKPAQRRWAARRRRPRLAAELSGF